MAVKSDRLEGDVVVVGGGNVAIDVARTALRMTDGKVTMLCLEQDDEMPAAKDEVLDAKAEGVEVINGWGPKEVLLEEGKVVGVVFKRCTNVYVDGRFSPTYDEEDTITASKRPYFSEKCPNWPFTSSRLSIDNKSSLKNKIGTRSNAS